MVNSDAQSNGDTTLISSSTTTPPQPPAKQKEPIECIELDDDDDVVLLEDEPPSKKAKNEGSESGTTATAGNESKPDTTTTESSYTSLLNQLEEHVEKVLKIGANVDRKLLDTLLSAINIQVQKEPYAVRKLILDKQLVLPNSISFPPSQVVDAVIEHDADMQISKVLDRMFGKDRIKLTDAEKRERLQFKGQYPAPSMTRALMEIGQDLVQESTYSDIVHAKNLPEMPKNVETYKQVAAQLKPVWEHLRDKNSSFKLKTYTCSVCGFKTENMLLMSEHKQTLHLTENKQIRCGMCPEYNTSGTRMHRHYIEKHGLTPLMPEEAPSKVQCPLCDQDFPFKGQRDAHLKSCKRELARIMSIQSTRKPEDLAMINRWLWSRPPADPIMQQQSQRRQQPEENSAQRSTQQQQQQRQNFTPATAAALAAQAPQLKQAMMKTQTPPTQKTPQQSVNSGNIGAVFASQQFQNQLKTLGPAQQAQLEQLLRSKANQLPPNVVNAIQAQIRQIQQQNQNQQQTQSVAKALSQVSQLNQLAKLNPQFLRTLLNQGSASPSNRNQGQQRKMAGSQVGSSSSSTSLNRQSFPATREDIQCEICDDKHTDKRIYLAHLQTAHSVLKGRNISDLDSGPPLACSRCRERFYSYEGLERHLVMNHSLVTSDLLSKAQNKLDGGRCKQCKKSFAFNILQHLASDHGAKLCSAEIMFSCDVCTFKCSSYAKLEIHLNESHPKNGAMAGKNGAH